MTKMIKEMFSIAQFARLTRTTRDTLLHYDKVGLLSPEVRASNNYRFYSQRQIAVLNVIHTCQVLGMTLSEIKSLTVNRTPELVSALLEQRMRHIDKQIGEWTNARKLLTLLHNTINPVLNINEDEITVQFRPAEAIVLGGLNDYSQGRTDYNALFSFYHFFHEMYPDLDLNYPVWAMFSEERIKQRDWAWPDRFYFHNPEGHDRKSAALYAIGYTRSGYGQKTGRAYERLLDYIDANGFEICGPAYEEYPLDEICVSDENNYLMRVMITVREKKKDERSKP